jgi:hypothetical protein
MACRSFLFARVGEEREREGGEGVPQVVRQVRGENQVKIPWLES